MFQRMKIAMIQPLPSLPPMPSAPISRSRGATLIEILITVLIMAFGLIGLVGLQTQSLKHTADTSQQSQATWMAHEIAERMRANTSALSDYELTNFATSSCATSPTKSCQVSSSDTCTSQEVAEYDIWEVFCRTASDTRSLPLSAVNISVDTSNSSVYIITLEWRRRSVFGDVSNAAPTQNLSLRIHP